MGAGRTLSNWDRAFDGETIWLICVLPRSSQPHLNQSIAKATNSREPFPPTIEPERGMVEAGVLQRAYSFLICTRTLSNSALAARAVAPVQPPGAS